MTDAIDQLEVNETPIADVENKVFITVDQRDVVLDQESLGINMQSDEAAILSAVREIVAENIVDGDGNFSYTVRKATNSNNIYVYPKPVAG